MGEAELMVRFAAGEPGGAGEMYRTYGRLVYAVTMRVLGDAGLAEDATRQTFARAWQLAPGADPAPGALGPWLAKIAWRTAVDIHHGRPGTATPGEPEPVSPAPSEEHANDVWLVRRALDTLSDQERELIRLQHSRQFTEGEIADRLGIPVETLRSRSHLAHGRFARRLDRLRIRSGAPAPALPVTGRAVTRG